jgi:lysophospholipase L1-like esterase
MKVVLVGIPRLDETQLNISHPGWLSAMFCNTKIDAMNAQINALASSYSNAVVATAAQGMSMTGKTTDGIHFTAAGYQAWIAALTETL